MVGIPSNKDTISLLIFFSQKCPAIRGSIAIDSNINRKGIKDHSGIL